MRNIPPLTVFGLNNDDREMKHITRFVAKYDIRYTVGLGSREAALAFGVNGWPTFMLFGRDGKLRYVQMGLGATTEKTLCEEIEKTIAEKKKVHNHFRKAPVGSGAFLCPEAKTSPFPAFIACASDY